KQVEFGFHNLVFCRVPLFVSFFSFCGKLTRVLIYGLRRRKNCALFVAGKVTDLWVPSSVMLAAFVTQLGGGASVAACSNVNLAVSPDGQETIIPPCGMPERSTESVGRAST